MENNQLTLLNKERPTMVRLALINMPEGTTMQRAENVIEREITNMMLILDMKPELKDCDQNSIIMAVKQCINDNLTLAPSAGLVYIYSGNIKIGVDSANQDVYKKVMVYEKSANGTLSWCRQTGVILGNKVPTYKFDASGALEFVTVEFQVPDVTGPRWESITYGKSHFAKWMSKSLAKFKKANANYVSWYGGIDPEFAATKAIKHGLNRRGSNMNEKQSQTPVNNISHLPATAIEKEQIAAKSESDYIQFEEIITNQKPPDLI